MNSVVGLRKARKGLITSVIEKAYDTWLTNPNQDLIPVMSLGWGKSCMASRKEVDGRTESDIISNPMNSTSFCPNVNFFLLKMIPCEEHSVRYWQVLKKISSKVESQSRVSSSNFVKFSKPATILSYRLVYLFPDAKKP